MFFASGVVILVSLINIAIPVALLCILQYFLSKMESPWPGRVLPILSGVSALCVDALLLFNMASMAIASSQGKVHIISGGTRSSAVMLIISMLLLWLPMVFYIVIYRRTRRHIIARKDMDRMSIQDLE